MFRLQRKWFYFFIVFLLCLVVWATRYWIRNPQLSFFVESIYEIPTDKTLLALSFDDGPNPACTPQLLDLLERYQVQANFWLIGQQIEAYPNLAKRIHVAGHFVGNHSYSHEAMIFKSTTDIEHDLLKTDSLLRSLGVEHLSYYRPPYGYSFIQLPRVLQAHQKRILTWSINPVAQYQLPQNATKILQQIEDEIYPGAILVLHDGGIFADCEVLLTVVEQLIKKSRSKGYELVRLDQVLAGS